MSTLFSSQTTIFHTSLNISLISCLSCLLQYASNNFHFLTNIEGINVICSQPLYNFVAYKLQSLSLILNMCIQDSEVRCSTICFCLPQTTLGCHTFKATETSLQKQITHNTHQS